MIDSFRSGATIKYVKLIWSLESSVFIFVFDLVPTLKHGNKIKNRVLYQILDRTNLT